MPYVALSGGNIHAGHRNALLLSGLAIMGALISNIWVRAFIWYFVAWVTFLFWAGIIGLANIQFVNLASTMTMYLTGAFFIYIAAQNSKNKITFYYNIICIAAILQALLSICQMWGHDLYQVVLELVYSSANKYIDPKTPTGSLGNNNFLSIFLAISLPFFYRKYWAYFVPVLWTIILVTITLTAAVAAFVGTILYFHDKIRWRWLALGTIPFIYYLCMTKASYTINFTWDHDRFQWWAMAIKNVFRMPWFASVFGLGPNAFWGKAFPIHNEFVEAFYDFGFIGIFFIAGYFLTLYRKNKKLWISLIIASITCLGSYPMHLGPSIALIILIMGLIERERQCHLQHIQ